MKSLSTYHVARVWTFVDILLVRNVAQRHSLILLWLRSILFRLLLLAKAGL